MKTVWISDTHNRKFDIPDGDVLFICGDMTMGTYPAIARNPKSFVGFVKEVQAFNEWMGTLPHKHKIAIAGNHDWLFELDNALARSLCTNFTYIQDETVEIDGFKIYGTPYQPEFFDWAFNVKRGNLMPIYKKIPKGTNILLTHSPAFGNLDQIPNGQHVGCEELDLYIKTYLDKLIIHGAGHIHHSYGIKPYGWPIRLNAAICDENYNPTHKPLEVEI